MMKQSLSALVIGMIFGFGLALAGMLNPAKVQGFLDITRIWDPSLAFVMVGGIGVAAIGFAILRRKSAPLFAETFSFPQLVKIDRPLLGGAALFGIGWGLGGLCPGPAIAVLSLAFWPVMIFVGFMALGLVIGRKLSSRA
ncbi:MAG: DUF6691 family protein [Candidatus Puniceispirillaceae bacterium]